MKNFQPWFSLREKEDKIDIVLDDPLDDSKFVCLCT